MSKVAALEKLLPSLDTYLTRMPAHSDLKGIRRFAVEFLFFGIKEARACVFVGLFFLAIFTVPHAGTQINSEPGPQSISENGVPGHFSSS
ncbi:hypothetical protein A6U88_02710 [Agrobacterium sp. B131/95]|uniref:Uncharacterized protein n=1 Tax=Rhizobium rhizogenes (strain K84 / ATCC BAA-868) TaxID=311403 RepID=B9JDV4_RHIR8|nr:MULTISPECIES: hypothetical protein [Rhizobium]ACM26305.1 hypothetical protein Arad_2010 [Rhizobium rhizogenes K84]EJK87145.1 hypothetical protein PMI03_01150 [Rhizobium sp. AP16]MDJ1632447.1 hypothetical protein [Rhizobium rhizogenes]OCJ25398.1 hypothetical protein A6U88_02710 [Agrobacterium sp. B131/95]